MEVIGVSKEYKSKAVFSNISISFDRGVYHLKGKNGTGKSVFCRCLLGLEEFSSGEIKDKGKKVLYLPNTHLGEEWLNWDENVDLLLYYFGLKLDDELKDDIYKKLGIQNKNSNYDVMSLGTTMKLGMVLIYIKEYWDLIVVDEVISHLDVDSSRSIVEELEERAREGTTVILVDHNLDTKDDELWNEIKMGD